MATTSSLIGRRRRREVQPDWILALGMCGAAGGIGTLVLVYLRKLHLRLADIGARNEAVVVDVERIKAGIDTLGSPAGSFAHIEEKADELAALMHGLQRTAVQANQVREEAEGRMRQELELQTAELKTVSKGTLSLCESLAGHGQKLYSLSASFLEFRRAIEERLETFDQSGLLDARSEVLDALGSLTAKLDAQDERLAEFSGMPAELDSQAMQLADLAGKLNTQADKLAGIDAVPGKLDWQRKRLTELADVPGKLDAQAGKLAALDAVPAKLDSQGKRLAELAGVPGKLDAQAGKLAALDAVPAKLDSQGKRLAELAGVPGKLDAQAGKLVALDAVPAKLDSQGKRLADLAGMPGKLDAQAGRLIVLDAVPDKLDSQGKRLAELAGVPRKLIALDAVSATLDSLAKRLEDLADVPSELERQTEALGQLPLAVREANNLAWRMVADDLESQLGKSRMTIKDVLVALTHAFSAAAAVVPIVVPS